MKTEPSSSSQYLVHEDWSYLLKSCVSDSMFVVDGITYILIVISVLWIIYSAVWSVLCQWSHLPSLYYRWISGWGPILACRMRRRWCLRCRLLLEASPWRFFNLTLSPQRHQHFKHQASKKMIYVIVWCYVKILQWWNMNEMKKIEA